MPDTIDIYHYDDYGFFISHESIVKTIGLGIPKNSTTVPVPKTKLEIYCKHRFIKTNNTWIIEEDHRGKKGYVGKEEIVITEIGPLVDVAPEAWVEGDYVKTYQEEFDEITELLTETRKQIEYKGPLVSLNGEIFNIPCEIKDETRLNSVTSIFEKTPELTFIDDWKIGKNTYITITPALVAQMKIVAFMHIGKTFQVERFKYSQLEESHTIEELKNWKETQLHLYWEDSDPIILG